MLCSTLLVVIMAFFTDGFLYGLVIPLMPYSPAQITSEWQFGVVSASYAVGVILATPVVGVLSDLFGRRRSMIWGALLQILAIIIFATATHFPAIVLAKIAEGAAAAVSWTAGLALIAQTYFQDRAKMMGLAILGNTCGLVLGPLAGGVLYDWSGFALPFLVMGALMCIDLTLRCFLLVDLRQQVKESIKFGALLRDRSVLVSGMVVVLSAWCWSVLEALIPNHLGQVAKATPSSVGVIFTLASIIYGFSCPWVGALTDKYGSMRAMSAGLFLMALIIPLLGLSTTIIGVGFLLALVSVAYGFAMNPTLSELGDAVDRHGGGGYATVYAIYNIAYSIGMITSNVTSGFVTSAFSLTVGLSVTALVMYLCLALAYLLCLWTYREGHSNDNRDEIKNLIIENVKVIGDGTENGGGVIA